MTITITLLVPDSHPWANPVTRPDELEVADTAAGGANIIFATVDGDGTYSGEVGD